MEFLRGTRVEIDLGAIASNLALVRRLAGDQTAIMLAIKADAYGHGAIEVARMVEQHSLVQRLGVAAIEEGIELRDSGITLPILMLGLVLSSPEPIEALCDYDIEQTIADPELALALSDMAARCGKTIKIHLKVDTGMGRIGCESSHAVHYARTVSTLPGIELCGIFSHMPVSDDLTNSFNNEQIKLFNSIVSDVRKFKPDICAHLANSAAIIQYPAARFDMVRPGIMSYGYLPSPDCGTDLALRPAMSLKSRIVFSKRVKAGTGISYGLTYRVEKDSNIATIPVGYGDGYPRSMSSRADVLIRGRRYPVAGRVCMDQILIDLGDDLYETGEEVILFGKDIITVNDIARIASTIPYEITCGISKRVPRSYIPYEP